MPLAAAAFAAAACGDGGDGETETDLPTASPAATVLDDTASPTDGDGANGADDCTPQTYEVQSGDTLSQIAVEFDVSVDAIAGASGIDDPNVLSVGQELTIPCPGQLPVTPAPEGEEAVGSPTPAP